MGKYALIGEKLGHSYSPLIHSKFGDYAYDLCEVAPEDLEQLLRGPWLDGFNVTIPYKETVIQYCDEISNESRRIGAVNVVVREGEKLKGYNTDYFGFRYLLEKNSIDVAGKKCLILGSGGASKTVHTVLEDLGARQIVVISRTGENHYGNIQKLHADAEIIVNTTPVGMYPENLKSLVKLDDFPELSGVVDVIYNPYRTKLILDAEKRKIPCASGLDMLVAQAWESSKIFQNTELDFDEIENVVETIRDSTLNKILIGMPGAGKTMLGEKMAERLCRTFVDIDDLIVEKEGMSIPEIFASKGEDYFRQVETKTLEEACKKSGRVIATGGGIVKRKVNYDILRQNGIVIWIKRDLDKLETAGRPLSITTPVEQLYAERKDAYASWSDYFIDNNQDMK